jgi:hypothetical protein
MTSVDHSTGKPLPPEAIQRVLYITPKVHIYQIPPLTSTKGYSAGQWSTGTPLFSPRLRIIETAIPSMASSKESVTTTIILEDPSTGELFAAAPYNHPSAVEHCLDSSRFFAIRVIGDGGRKATLGMGFEERSDAFDFGVALQEARKVMELEGEGKGATRQAKQDIEAEKKDFSLKEGETITVNFKGMGRRQKNTVENASSKEQKDRPSFVSVPSSDKVPFLPPPPSAVGSKRRSRELSTAPPVQNNQGPTAQELGFDDGEFGEFQ